jgi:CRP/FNR family cyclic AMP-dependent transcriptional regulator
MDTAPMDLLDTIKNNYVFRGLATLQLAAVTAVVQQKEYMGGDMIVRQFDKNCDLMIIVSGNARISSFSGEMIAEVGPGSLIGEMSLIDDQPRSATVTAIGPTRVAVLPYSDLKGLLQTDRDLAATVTLNIARVLAQRLRNANMQLDAALTKN